MRWGCGIAIVLLGCGSVEPVTSQDAAPDVAPDAIVDASPPDAALEAAPPLTVCPLAPPTSGASCSTISELICEYGEALSPSCDALFECFSDNPCANVPSTWHQTGPTATCPTSLPNCPSSYAQAADGGACALSTRCNYVEGWCACNGAWQCTPAPPSCTANRPRLGTACSPDTLDPFKDACPFQLDYGTCTGYVCASGTVMPSGCPIVPPPPPPPPPPC